MNQLFDLFQNYPGFTAVVVAVITVAAYVFDMAFLRNRTMAGASWILGLLVLLACLWNAINKGLFEIGVVVIALIVCVTLVNFLQKKIESHDQSTSRGPN